MSEANPYERIVRDMRRGLERGHTLEIKRAYGELCALAQIDLYSTATEADGWRSVVDAVAVRGGPMVAWQAETMVNPPNFQWVPEGVSDKVMTARLLNEAELAQGDEAEPGELEPTKDPVADRPQGLAAQGEPEPAARAPRAADRAAAATGDGAELAQGDEAEPERGDDGAP